MARRPRRLRAPGTLDTVRPHRRPEATGFRAVMQLDLRLGMKRLTINRPDDWHVHFRDGDMLDLVVPDTARRFARAIAMPNLVPPIVNTDQALAYRDRIQAAAPRSCEFEALMTLYLTDETSADEILRARECGDIHGVKLYPAGATTNSAHGVTDLRRTHRALAAMQETELPLLVHGEVVGDDIDVFDRERVFVETVLAPLLEQFPDLRVVLEHVTTSEAVDFVRDGPDTLAATITAHHLLLSRNALFKGGLRPHYYCLPVLKREQHRRALVSAATGGSSKFFLGTDSAPHAKPDKESACGCAGIYTAHAAIELYAAVFEAAGRLENLEAFASVNGARFYRLPVNTTRITLEKQAWRVPEELRYAHNTLVPFAAGEELEWKLVEA
jgi:dihydroorotase